MTSPTGRLPSPLDYHYLRHRLGGGARGKSVIPFHVHLAIAERRVMASSARTRVVVRWLSLPDHRRRQLKPLIAALCYGMSARRVREIYLERKNG